MLGPALVRTDGNRALIDLAISLRSEMDGCFLILSTRKSSTEAREIKAAPFAGLAARNSMCICTQGNTWSKYIAKLISHGLKMYVIINGTLQTGLLQEKQSGEGR